ncbi:MAG: hypothetical protein FK734_13480 [Asgard group archaeon]|nr:hypothetical protein [Asgard group archaeon]
MSNFIIEANLQIYLGDSTDEGMTLRERYTGNILMPTYSEKNDEEEYVRIGSIEFWFLLIAKAANQNLSIVEAMDMINQDSYDYAFCAFNMENDIIVRDREGEFHEKPETLILHKMELFKEYQNKGYGAEIAKSLIDRYRERCNLVLLMPAPQQFKQQNNKEWLEKYNNENFSQNQSKALERLTNHWKTLGFLPTLNNPDILYLIQEDEF